MNDEYLWMTYDFNDLSLLRLSICGFGTEITFHPQKRVKARNLGLWTYLRVEEDSAQSTQTLSSNGSA